MPTRVLFLCWGYSIHAQRRVQIFIDDDRFDVTVVSTHDYGFQGAKNVLLTSASDKASATRGRLPTWLPVLLRPGLRKLATFLRLPFELRVMRRDFGILRNAVRRFEPDVVFLQTLQYPSFLAYGLAQEQRMIVTFWNGDLTHFAKWTSIEMLLKKRLVVHGLRRVDAITVNSQTALDAAVRLGADPHKITLLRYPGADLALFYPRDRDACRKQLDVRAKHVVLCPRGLGAFFNSRAIVYAAAELAKSHDDILFLFISDVGGREEWAQHAELAARLGIAEKVRWDGHVPWQQMPLYYGATNVMVSIMTADSCPNCMLEAMACGIPVVMSDTQQNREWIDDGRNGFLRPPRDAEALSTGIARILDDASLAQQFATLSRKKVEKHANSALNVESIRALVLDVAHKSSRGAAQLASSGLKS